MAKPEPFLTSEKITNDDGSPSDYLVRYLNKIAAAGEKTITFPVTSVNGMTGAVVLTLDELIGAGGIDYDKLNAKLQEMITQGMNANAYTDNRIEELKSEDDPFDQYAFRIESNYANDDYMNQADITYSGTTYYHSGTAIYCPYYRPGLSPQSSAGSNGYRTDLITGAYKGGFTATLFTVERKINVYKVMCQIAANAGAGGVASTTALSQDWRICIYSCAPKEFTIANSYGTDNTIYMRFPHKLIWSSPIMNTKDKITTYKNDYFYGAFGTSLYPHILSMPISVDVPTASKTLDRGTYFACIMAANNSSVPTSAALNQMFYMTDITSGVHTNSTFHTTGAMLFPSLSTAYFDLGKFTSSGGFITNQTHFIVYNTKGNDVVSNYVTAPPDNMLSTYSAITFDDSLSTFTDPLTGATANIAFGTGCIGGLYFRASYA